MTDPRRTPIRVPEITLLFWIVKILTTGMGETTSDFFAKAVDPVLAVGVTGLVLVLTLALQFSLGRYVAWVYWLNVVMVSIFGTMAADVAHVGLGIPYLASTATFAVVLAGLFLLWYRLEGTLSIHSIDSFRREGLYWATVLTTFALGTAGGDMTAMTLGWGYWWSGLLFLGLFLVPVVAFQFFHLGEVTAFWAAYILTRPLGASFADWAGVSPDRGGLDLGTGPVSLVLFALIALLVLGMTLAGRQPRIR